MDYQLLTDSACDLSRATLEQAAVPFVPFHFRIQDQDLDDDLGASYDLAELYAAIKSGVMPSTRQINVGEYADFFRPYVEAEMPIVYLGFSSGLSGSLSSAEQAKAMLLEDYPTATIEIVDTLAASMGEGRLVLEAIRLRDSGTPLAELVAWLNANKLRLQHWFTVDNLDYLYHGGRVSKTAATLGTLLNVKPVLDVDPAGHLRPVTKVRARKRALLTLAERVLDALSADPTQPILIASSGDAEAAQVVADAIQKEAPATAITIGNIGLTIASHTGYGCVAAFVMGDTDRV